MVPEVRSIGVLARRALSLASRATVFARFERSFCLEVDRKLITIGDLNLHDGPLNVRLAGTYGSSLTSTFGIERGQHWGMSPVRLRRTDGLEIDLTRATVWQPDEPPVRPDRAQLSRSLKQLLNLLRERKLPEDGLIRLVLDTSPPRTSTEYAAKPHIEVLKVDLPNRLKGKDADPDAAIELLGLGPGLTPSGDDLLAGLMIAWNHIGMSAASNRLASILLAAAAARTTPISLVHLDAAAEGYGAAPLHDLLEALFADDRKAIAEALDATAKIGHSSGMDAIAGVMLALNAWIEAGQDAPIAA